MCRMYASLGPGSAPAGELMAFRNLCKEGCGGPHADGWGIVAFPRPGLPTYLGREPTAAILDKRYAEAAALAPGAGPAGHGAVLAHLRAASVGGKVLEHTHPFLDGPWAFAHNGTIHKPYAERMAPGAGLNDSRAFFRRVRARLAGRADPVEALRGAVAEVREGGFRFTSITTLLTDGEALYATRAVTGREDYYTLRWQRRGSRWVVCQEAILDGPWEDLPNGSLAVFRAGKDQPEVLPL